MSDEKIAVTELEQRMRPWIDDHTRQYLESRGAQGHILDMRMLDGYQYTPNLLLKTIGRKSGEVRYAPLIYGCIGGNLVVIASRGGADLHPAWYFNIQEEPTVTFQVGGQAFRGSWRIVEGDERATLWAFMGQIYPHYDRYQAQTERHIPVVVFTPEEEIEIFEG